MYTDHPCAFSVPSDSSSRGVHFREEAMRLFALEEGRTSLATVQAMPSLCFGYVFREYGVAVLNFAASFFQEKIVLGTCTLAT